MCCKPIFNTIPILINKLLETANEDGEKLIQEADETVLRELITNLTIEDNKNDFSYIYNYKMDIEALVLQSINLSNINTIINTNTSGVPFIINKAIRTGIVAYYTDGYEQKQETSLTKLDFLTENYKKNIYSSGDLIETGSPVYKSINSENWTLYYELTKEEEALYKEDTRMKIKVVKDNTTLVGDFSLIYIEGIPYAKLILNQYMKEYVSERFLEIKIIGKETTGLKIPKTSALKKDFYVIPKVFREIAKEENLEINIVKGNMCDLTMFSEGFFDLIINPLSLMYVPELSRVFNECYRVLDKGGIFIIMAPSPINYLCDFYDKRRKIYERSP